MEGAHPHNSAGLAPLTSVVSHEDVVKAICEFCRLSGYHETVRSLQKESLVPFNTVSCLEELPPTSAQPDSPRRGADLQQATPGRPSSQNGDSAKVQKNTLEEALLKGKWGTVLPLLDRLLLSMPTQFALFEALILDLCMDPGLASAAEQLLFHSPPLKQLKKAQGTRFARLEHLVRTAKAHPERMATEPGCSSAERANVRKAAWVALASEIRCIGKTAQDGTVTITQTDTTQSQPVALLFQAISAVVGEHTGAGHRKRPRAADGEVASQQGNLSAKGAALARSTTEATLPKRLALLADLTAVPDPAGAVEAQPTTSLSVSASCWVDASSFIVGTQNGSLVLFRPRYPQALEASQTVYQHEVLTKGNAKNGPIVALASCEVEFPTSTADAQRSPQEPYYWVGSAFLDGTIKVYGLRVGDFGVQGGEEKKRWQLLRVIRVTERQGAACLCFVGRPWAWIDAAAENVDQSPEHLFDGVLCYGMNDGSIGLCSVLQGQPDLAIVNSSDGAEGQVQQLSVHFTSAAIQGAGSSDNNNQESSSRLPGGGTDVFLIVASFANGTAASFGPLSLGQILSGKEYPAPTKKILMSRQQTGSSSAQVLLGLRDQKEEALARHVAASLGHPIPMAAKRLLLCPKAVPWHAAVAVVVDLTSGVVLDRVQLKDAASVLAQEDRELTIRQVVVQGRNVYFLLSNNTILCRSDLASLMWRSGGSSGGAANAAGKTSWSLFSLMHLTPDSSIGDDRKARSTFSSATANVAASSTMAECFLVAPAALDSATSSFVAASNRWLLWSRGSHHQGQHACALALLA